MERKGKRMGYQARSVDMSRVQDRAAGRAQQTAQSAGNEHQRRSKPQRYLKAGYGLIPREYTPGSGNCGTPTTRKLKVYTAWLDGRAVKQTPLSDECSDRAERLGVRLQLRDGYYYPTLLA